MRRWKTAHGRPCLLRRASRATNTGWGSGRSTGRAFSVAWKASAGVFPIVPDAAGDGCRSLGTEIAACVPRARPVGWQQNCGTGRRLSTALIDDLLDERFAANREQVTQPRLTDAPLRERTGAPAPSCQTNGYGYTTRCTHLSAPKRTARSLRPTRQELKTSQLGGYAKVRESIETKRGWRGSQLNPVVAPRVRASSRGVVSRLPST